MSLSEDVDLEEFILTKDDLSGADIKAVCTEAGLLALRERRMRVTKADFTAAREKVGSYAAASQAMLLMHILWSRFYTARRRGRRKVYTCDFLSVYSRFLILTCLLYGFDQMSVLILWWTVPAG